MRRELLDILAAYLSEWKTLRDCAEWLAGVQWDDLNLSEEDREMAGHLELLATEVAEGLRPEAEFWQEAAAIVAVATNSLYLAPLQEAPIRIAGSTNNDLVKTPEFIVTSAEVSRSWSISPLLVPA